MRSRSVFSRLALTLCLAAGVSAGVSAPRLEAREIKGSVLLLAKGGKIVDKSAEVKNAVVIWRPAVPVKGVSTNRTFTMATHQKEFEPRVLTIPVGASVAFGNADPILHNAFSVSAGNRFDLGLARKGVGKSWTFKSPGLVRVFCNVHHSMVGYIWVLDTPFSTMPDAAGNFTLTGLPEGAGTLEVWHEQTELWSETFKNLPHEAVGAKLEVTRPRVPSHVNKLGQSYNQHGDSY
ncbi:MAG: hypothetical protein ABI609_01850 [Acidobacteriota bacterium]